MTTKTTTGKMLTPLEVQMLMKKHSTAVHYAIMDFKQTDVVLDDYTTSDIWELRRVEMGYPPAGSAEFTEEMQGDCDSYVQEFGSWRAQMKLLVDAYTGDNGGANYSFEISKRVQLRVHGTM